MSQRDRVLEMLQAAGSRGVHTFEMRREYIGNPSQRIAELEARGHTITHCRERLNGAAVGTRYRLVTEVASPRVPLAAVEPTEESLFDPAVLNQPLSPYDQEAA